MCHARYATQWRAIVALSILLTGVSASFNAPLEHQAVEMYAREVVWGSPDSSPTSPSAALWSSTFDTWTTTLSASSSTSFSSSDFGRIVFGVVGVSAFIFVAIVAACCLVATARAYGFGCFSTESEHALLADNDSDLTPGELQASDMAF